MERIHPQETRSCVATSGTGEAIDALGTVRPRRKVVCLFDSLSWCKTKESSPRGYRSHVESTDFPRSEATRDGKISDSPPRRAVPRLQLSLRPPASLSRESLLAIGPHETVIFLRVVPEQEKAGAFLRTPSTRQEACYFSGRSVSKRTRFTNSCRRHRRCRSSASQTIPVNLRVVSFWSRPRNVDVERKRDAPEPRN